MFRLFKIMSFKVPVNILSKYGSSKAGKQVLDRIVKEFEIYNYFADLVPSKFEEKDWQRLLTLPDLRERVSYYYYMALTQQREQRDKEKDLANRARKQETYENELAKYQAGGMGYGKNMYRLITDPFLKVKELDDSIFSRVIIPMRLQERAKLILDFQFVPQTVLRNQRKLGKQFEQIIEAYRHSYESMELECINVDMKEPATSHLFQLVPSYRRTKESRLPYLKLLPELHVNNPYSEQLIYRAGRKPEDQVVYLSRHATEVLDGPLTHKAYVMPICLDNEKESLSVCRKYNYRAMRLPIDNYVKWQSGKKVIPFVNIFKIFNRLCANNCNWREAFFTFIARHHFVPAEELIRNMSPHEDWKRKRKHEITKLTNLIGEAMARSSGDTTST